MQLPLLIVLDQRLGAEYLGPVLTVKVGIQEYQDLQKYTNMGLQQKEGIAMFMGK